MDLVSNIRVGGPEARDRDVLGRVSEYFLGQFASAEGWKGGAFYTLRCVVKLLVEMLEPFQGRVYDPCWGADGLFVQSVEFIEAHAISHLAPTGYADFVLANGSLSANQSGEGRPASTAMSSHPVGMWAHWSREKTLSRSPRRWPGWGQNGAVSRLRPADWTR